MSKSKNNKNIKEKKPFSSKKVHFLIIAIFGFVFFGNTIKNGFNMDDDLVTTTPDSVHPNVEKGISGIPSIFSSRYAVNVKQQYGYRPVTTASFAMQYSFFGDKEMDTRASISHFINLVLYIINGVLVYLVLFNLFDKYKESIALVGSVLFVIHPLHSEVANNIKCRDELLVLFFGFLAILLVLKYLKQPNENRKHIYLIYVLFMLLFSVLSKKNGLTFVVTIPLIVYYFTNTKTKYLTRVFVASLLGALVFFLIDKVALSDATIREKLFLENPLYTNGGLINKIPMFFYTIGWYLQKMIIPFPLSFYYGYSALPMANWGHVLTWVGFLFVVPTTIMCLVRIKKKEIWAFGFLFFMLSIGGISNIRAIAPGIVAERFAYLPSFGLIAALAYYLVIFYNKYQSKKNIKLAFWAFGSVVILLSLIHNFNRNKMWMDKLTLYRGDVVHNNKSAKSYSLLGQEYIRYAHNARNDFIKFQAYSDSAITALKGSLDVYPGYWTSANNIGYVYQNFLLDNEKAIHYFKYAISQRDNYSEALFGLAGCQNKTIGEIEKIQQCLGYIQVDSVEVDNIDLEGFGLSDSIFQAAFFENEIESTYKYKLKSKGLGLLDKNSHAQYLVEFRQSIVNFLLLEKGLLKKRFDFEKELIGPTNQALSMMNKETVGDLVNTINQGVSFKFNLFNASYLSQRLNIKHFVELQRLNEFLLSEKTSVVDSTVEIFDQLIVSDSLEIRYYEEASKFLYAQGRVNKYIEINELGISRVGMENKVQLYINLANVYNFKENSEKALLNIDLALENAKKLYKKALAYKGENRVILIQEKESLIQNLLKVGIAIAEKFNKIDKLQEWQQELSKY